MKINELIVEQYDDILDEYGNRPNNSTDPRAAGGAPNAIGNLKDRRLARAAKAQSTQTAPPVSGANPGGADPVPPPQPTNGANPGNTEPAPSPQGNVDTAQDTANTGNRNPRQAGVPKGKPGFFSSLARGMGADQAGDAIDAYDATKLKGSNVATAQDTTDTAQDTTDVTTPPVAPKPQPKGQQQGGQGQQGQQQGAQGAQGGQGTQPPQQPTDVNKDPKYAMFKDPAAFKAEWDKYVEAQNAKNQEKGMGPFKLITEPELLSTLKDMWMRTGGLSVKESRYSKKSQRLVEQRIMKDPLYENFRRVGRIMVEAELTQQQIQQIFKAVADGAAAGGNVKNAGDEPVSNRTLLGKGGDVAQKVAKAWDDVKTKISQSGPVSGFDQMVDSLQGKLLNAAGGESGAVGQALAKYKEFAHQHPVMQGAIYAGLIALAGISGAGLGGAALLAGIKTFDKLLQGDKASSALWKGFKTGAIAYAAGQIGQAMKPHPTVTHNVSSDEFHGTIGQGDPNLNIPPGGGGTVDGIGPGDEIVPPPQYIDPTNPDAWIDGTEANGTDMIPYTVQRGETLSQIAKSNGISVKDIMDANPSITNPNNLPTGIELQLPQNVENYNVYDQGVGTAANTAQGVASGKYAPNWPGIKESRYIDATATRHAWMLSESLGRPATSVQLTEAGVAAVLRAVANEGVWDTIKNVGSKVAGGVEKVGQAVGGAVKKGWDSAANKITYDKLDLNWRKNYKEFDPTGGKGPVDSEQVKAFLRKQGVTDVLIDKVFGDLNLNADQVQAEPEQGQGQQAQQNQAPAQTGTIFDDPMTLRKLFMDFQQNDGRIAIQVRGVLKDILMTAMNKVESIIRQRNNTPPKLNEVKTDFSRLLLK